VTRLDDALWSAAAGDDAREAAASRVRNLIDAANEARALWGESASVERIGDGPRCCKVWVRENERSFLCIGAGATFAEAIAVAKLWQTTRGY
jgi:hypothetical protein